MTCRHQYTIVNTHLCAAHTLKLADGPSAMEHWANWASGRHIPAKPYVIIIHRWPRNHGSGLCQLYYSCSKVAAQRNWFMMGWVQGLKKRCRISQKRCRISQERRCQISQGGAGSQKRGAGSEIRRDPAQKKHLLPGRFIEETGITDCGLENVHGLLGTNFWYCMVYCTWGT